MTLLELNDGGVSAASCFFQLTAAAPVKACAMIPPEQAARGGGAIFRVGGGIKLQGLHFRNLSAVLPFPATTHC